VGTKFGAILDEARLGFVTGLVMMLVSGRQSHGGSTTPFPVLRDATMVKMRIAEVEMEEAATREYSG